MSICTNCNARYDEDTPYICCGVCSVKLVEDCTECGVRYIKCIECDSKVCSDKEYIRVFNYTGIFYICIKCYDKPQTKIMDGQHYYWVDIYTMKTHYNSILNANDTKIKQLEEENNRLETMLAFQPGGEGYLEAKANFDQAVSSLNSDT